MANKEFTADKTKVLKVIASCVTPAHFESATKMYELFCTKWGMKEQYKIEYVKDCWEIYGFLRGQWEAKKPITI